VGLVLPAAQFALTDKESAEFAKKGSRYAYVGENEDDESAAASITRENANLGNEDGEGGHDAAAPEVDAVDLAGGSRGARLARKERARRRPSAAPPITVESFVEGPGFFNAGGEQGFVVMRRASRRRRRSREAPSSPW
jgi:hypothetical protein